MTAMTGDYSAAGHGGDGLKIAVLGGGSTYTPELIDGFLREGVPVREIALVDPDAGKLAVVGGLARRMVAAAGLPIALPLLTERAPALDGADVVITQLRVGGLAARALDERIPLRYGLVGQETTGPGGFAKALRTIPVILDINREMAARCPDAWLINFTNPSGLIAEALRLHGRGRFVGLCNYPLTLKMKAASALGVPAERVELAYVGLNHLSWARVLVDGADRTRALIDVMCADPAHSLVSGYAFAPERLRALGLIPSGYLRYYYETAKMVRELHEAPQTRGELVAELEKRLLACYADPALCAKPEGLQERGGAWYSTAAVRLVRDLQHDAEARHVLNVPNRGAVALLPDEVIVETSAAVSRHGVRSLPTVVSADAPALAGHPLPPEVVTLLRRVKDYELLAVEAAVHGDRDAARRALAAHPLLDGRHDAIPALLDDLLTAHRAYLPRFVQ